MSNITVSETINATLEEVFEAASNIPECASYIDGIEAIETLKESPESPNNIGVVGEGYTWRETRIMFGKTATEDMTIINWSPPNSYQVEARSCGCYYLSDFTFEHIGDQTTKMTMSFNGTPESFGAKIMMFVFSFMTKKMAKLLAKDLHDIKVKVESNKE